MIMLFARTMLYRIGAFVDRVRTLVVIILWACVTIGSPTQLVLADEPAKAPDVPRAPALDNISPVEPAPAPTVTPTPIPAPAPSSRTKTEALADNAEADPSMTLRGSVWRTKAGIVFLKTPVGLLTLSSKTTLKDLKASQEVSFWLHERHMVIEIRKKTDGSLVHRYVTGPLTPDADNPKMTRWWTHQGSLSVHGGTLEERLASLHEGDDVTVEVDDSNTVIGVHDLQFDLQISQAPPSGSDAHLLLSGTVSKLKSNFVFFRTPVGVVMVNAKIGLPPVKVGQAITLRIDQARVSADLASAKPAAPRAPAVTSGSASPMP